MTDRIDAKLDEIYDEIDSFFRSGNFSGCNDVLKNLNLKILSSDLILGYLTATLPARSKLPYRPEFLKNVETELKSRGEYKEGLLSGL